MTVGTTCLALAAGIMAPVEDWRLAALSAIALVIGVRLIAEAIVREVKKEPNHG